MTEPCREPEAPAPLRAAPCPWCPDGSRLTLRGDGFGGAALWCVSCGCKGPTVRIAGDFEEADRQVVERWSRRGAVRPGVSHDTVARVMRALGLQELLHGEVRAGAAVPIRHADVRALLTAAGVDPAD